MATVCIPYWRVFAALDCNFTNIMSIHLLHAIYTHWQSRGPLTLLAVFVCLPALVVGHFSNIENDGWNGAQRSQSRAKWPCFEMYEQNLTDFRCILSLYESSKHGVFDFWSNYWLEMGNSWTIALAQFFGIFSGRRALYRTHITTLYIEFSHSSNIKIEYRSKHHSIHLKYPKNT